MSIFLIVGVLLVVLGLACSENAPDCVINVDEDLHSHSRKTFLDS